MVCPGNGSIYSQAVPVVFTSEERGGLVEWVEVLVHRMWFVIAGMVRKVQVISLGAILVSS